MDYGTFDTPAAMEASLEEITGLFGDFGVKRVYIKKLAPNDNSKNQPYFGAHLPDVAFLPSGSLVGSLSTSTKEKKRSIKYQTALELSWLDSDGSDFPAPDAKLIYYPQYPEVRFSGFLKGSRVKAGEWMDPKKQGRAVGRWLIIGVAPDKKIYAYLAVPDSNLSRELEDTIEQGDDIFNQLSISHASSTGTESSKQSLINTLKEIHLQGWVPSQKMGKDGVSTLYKAPNGGGYTLESLLGISPNGYADPDYLGWEVKQFGVTKMPAVGAKVTTLFTPEPDGGVYIDPGFVDFMKKYGYADKSGIADRINFGGTHYYGERHKATALTLSISGFDTSESLLLDPNGDISLVDDSDQVAASWSFNKIMEHWKRKHALAVFVPCLKKKDDSGTYYHYGNHIELGTGAGFEMLLSSIIKGSVYYDPGLKLENVSTSPKQKKRNQFRVKHQNLKELYKTYEFVDTKNGESL